MNFPDIYLYRCGCGPYFYYGAGRFAASDFCVVHNEDIECIWPIRSFATTEDWLQELSKTTIAAFAESISYSLGMRGPFDSYPAREYRINRLKNWILWSTGVRL